MKLAARGPSFPGTSFLVALVSLFVLGCLLAFVPLFNLLGYEFCAALSLAVSVTAGPVGIAAARRRLALLAGGSRPERVLAAAWLGALVLNLAALLPPLLVILLNALRVRNCNLGEGFLFFLLLPVFTAGICSAWGTTVGFLVRRRIMGGLAYAGLWMALAFYGFYQFWAGPQMDSYNQLIGWMAGPVMEEVARPDTVLLLARVHGLLWALGVLAACAALLDMRRGGSIRAGALWSNRRLLLPAGALGLAALALLFTADSIGFGRSDRAVLSELSATTRTEHFVIHHAPDLEEERLRLLAEDHQFRYRQIAAAIGPFAPEPIHSYVFTDAAGKQRLTGAGRTQFAKPWRRSMYLNGAVFPHPTLKHELVHVLAADFGSWPFRASARWGIWQNVGLIEGLAVALDWPADEFSVHTWSAAQRRVGQAPDVRSLFDPLGFWTKPQARAYVLSGSFVRFILDGYGADRFKRAYRAGSLEGIYPKSPQELFREWEEFLDRQSLPPGLLEAARDKFSRPSIFSRVCAREMAALFSRARGLLAAGRPSRARDTVSRILSHQPQDPQALILLAEAHDQEKRLDSAAEILAELIQRQDLDPALRNRLRGRLGDLLVRQDRPEEARGHFQALLQAHLDDGSDRQMLVRLEALEQGQAGAPVLSFLQSGTADPAAILGLRETTLQRPRWGTGWYLLGRQLFNRELHQQALPYLERAAQEGFSSPQLAAENMRLLAVAHYRLGNRHQAATLLAVLSQLPRHEGEMLWAQDWIERIGFGSGAIKNWPLSIFRNVAG